MLFITKNFIEIYRAVLKICSYKEKCISKDCFFFIVFFVGFITTWLLHMFRSSVEGTSLIPSTFKLQALVKPRKWMGFLVFLAYGVEVLTPKISSELALICIENQKISFL